MKKNPFWIKKSLITCIYHIFFTCHQVSKDRVIWYIHEIAVIFFFSTGFLMTFWWQFQIHIMDLNWDYNATIVMFWRKKSHCKVTNSCQSYWSLNVLTEYHINTSSRSLLLLTQITSYVCSRLLIVTISIVYIIYLHK